MRYIVAIVFFGSCLGLLWPQDRPRAVAAVEWSALEPQARVRVTPLCPVDKLPPDVPGAVMVRIIVGTDGRVRKASAYAGAGLLLDRAAEALAKWEFVPQALNGEPVEVQSMAVIEVCKQAEQPQVEASLYEVKRLTGECSDEANDDAEKSCVEAMTLADGMTGELAMLGRWWAYAAYGNLRARQGRPKEADEIFTKALAWFREQPLSGAMQLDFLWQLAALREGLRDYERALQPYRDAEALVETAMDQMESAKLAESTYREAHAAQVRHMKRALEGEIRCLLALKRDSEADILRIRVTQLK